MGSNIEGALALASTENEEEKENFQNILNAVENALTAGNLRVKTRLTQRNIRGILKVEAQNAWLMRFGKCIDLEIPKKDENGNMIYENGLLVTVKRKTYVQNRILNIIACSLIELKISEQGKGREELIQIANALTPSINSFHEISAMERLMGKNRRM